MDKASLGTVPVANPISSFVARQGAAFVAISFGISWLIWIAAIRLGAHPGRGEEILAFGSPGPAIAGIFLSRSRRKAQTIGPTARLLWFLLLWIGCWAAYILSDKMRGVTPHPSASFSLIVALLALIPAWIGSGAISSDTGVWSLLRTLAVPQNWRWQAIAFFSLPAILLVPTAILHALGRPLVWGRPSTAIGPWVAYGALMFFRTLFFTAFLEEPGWRGFLLPCLQRKFSPLVASFLVWIPWSVWHLPLDFGGPAGRSVAAYFQTRVVSLLLVAAILTWLYNRSGGNLLCVAIFHAGMNTFPAVLPYAPVSLVLVLTWAAYAVVADRMWRQG